MLDVPVKKREVVQSPVHRAPADSLPHLHPVPGPAQRSKTHERTADILARPLPLGKIEGALSKPPGAKLELYHSPSATTPITRLPVSWPRLCCDNGKNPSVLPNQDYLRIPSTTTGLHACFTMLPYHPWFRHQEPNPDHMSATETLLPEPPPVKSEFTVPWRTR